MERREHYIKCDSYYYDDVLNYNKPFEYRLNDRDYKVGDLIVLEEWNTTRKIYTGRSCIREITYILEDELYLPKSHCIMAIK